MESDRTYVIWLSSHLLKSKCDNGNNASIGDNVEFAGIDM